jgi:hypothetical protein
VDPRDRWAGVLTKNPQRLGELELLEKEAKAAAGQSASRDALAKRFATLDSQLAGAARESVAHDIAGWLPTLAERFPILKDIVLGKPP